MTEQELQLIKGRAEKATASEWQHTWYGSVQIVRCEDDILEVCNCWLENGVNDAIFIAHARQDVPALIEEVERLRKVLEFYAEENNNRHKIDLTVGKFDLMSEVTKDEGNKARIALFGVSNE